MKTTYRQIVEVIRNIYHESEGFIPLHVPKFGGNEKAYLEQCIDSTYVSSVGRFVDEFEKKMASFTGAKYAVVCVNGTNALHISLLLSDVKPETEVITQPLSFIATANAIRYCNAIPSFIDVDSSTLSLSPEKLQYFLRNGTKIIKTDGKVRLYNKHTNREITAVLPMHTFGHAARIDEIVEICNQYELPVIEDAAESLGSWRNGKHTGTFGRFGVLSFNGNKILTTGGGGMILTDNEDLAIRAKHVSNTAKVPHSWEYEHDEIGYNYRMPNINAALGLAQMEQLKEFVKQKRKIAELYKNAFANLNIKFFTEPKNTRSNYWLNSIFLEDRKSRDEFLEYSNNNGVMTRPAWKLIPEQPMFTDCYSEAIDSAKTIADGLVNIPSSVI